MSESYFCCTIIETIENEFRKILMVHLVFHRFLRVWWKFPNYQILVCVGKRVRLHFVVQYKVSTEGQEVQIFMLYLQWEFQRDSANCSRVKSKTAYKLSVCKVSGNVFFEKLNVFLIKMVDLKAKMFFAILFPYILSIFWLVSFWFTMKGIREKSRSMSFYTKREKCLPGD